MPAVGTPERRLIDTTPVVDIHTHTFNSRFLPIREIALGKRDFLGNFSFLANDGRTKAIAKSITRWTIAREQHSRPLPPVPSEEEGTKEDIELAANSTGKIMEPGSFPADQRELTITERRELGRFVSHFGHPNGILSFLPFLSPFLGSHEIEHFVDCLATPISETEPRFLSDLTPRKRIPSKITLNVSHMMDMAPSYDQKEDGRTLVPIKEQISTMRRQQAAAGGQMLYFVAYNPFRDHWQHDPAAHLSHAVEIVKDAYQNHGAFGVKIYPPSGYLPLGNLGHIPGRPISRFSQPGRQWDARYTISGIPITGQELDRSLLQLFQWCSDEGVPIFTHCGQGEVKAQSGYDAFANPENWRTVLQRFPKLHLCLGHAGGGPEWYSPRDLTGWGKTVSELCREFENVYCEFGCQDSIADPSKRSAFSRQIQRQIQKNEPSRPFSFAAKILYGSDWFMPMPQSSDRLNHLLAHQTAIYAAGGSELYRSYFFRNSLAYLNARKRIEMGGLPTPLRKRLNDLLRLNQ